MVLIAWAVVGAVLGAVGSEILRAKKPRLISKVESAAKQLVDCICSEKPSDEQTGEQEGDDHKASN